MPDNFLVLRGMHIFATINRIKTIEARYAGKIEAGDAISEPIIIMAESLEVAEFILYNSLASDKHDTPDECEVAYRMKANNLTRTTRPLIKMVTNGLDFPFYLKN